MLINTTYKRGTHPNSRNGFKRQYTLWEEAFDCLTSDSCYYAGLLAADGDVAQDRRKLNLTATSKDVSSLKGLKKFLRATYPIQYFTAKDKFPTASLTLSSTYLCSSLLKNFSIGPRKSLTLLPPEITDKCLKDAFIIGYIDGDGSIGLYSKKRQEFLSISLMGTLEVCNWIRDRFEQILGKPIDNLVVRNNSCVLQVTCATARTLFLHYYPIRVPKLHRKWKNEYYLHCVNYKKFINVEKYKEVLKYTNQGKNQSEIARILGLTPAAISWRMKSSTYYSLLHETKVLDKEVVNIEEDGN